MTQSEMEMLLRKEVKGLSSQFVPDDYTNSCDDASRETGFSFPATDDFEIHWLKLRAKRHLFFYLFTESSIKFKIKQLSINQRFDHLAKAIEMLDKDFIEIQESRPEKFASVSAYKMFGTKVDAGFSYDDLGRDSTFDKENLVNFFPKA